MRDVHGSLALTGADPPTKRHEVVREADRMFKLSPERRAHRPEKAKTELVRAAGAKGGKTVEMLRGTNRAVAIILSQGINEI